ncbi:MaoC family dehydratase N-terminal domain-containing protein [Microbacterium sp. HD4P20]|uniref:FAS1-like dehydratase domain-containing protein n=1 Tax=Microbacterium sp. HD4P20 TaxID=2864874 RepID=UPI001C6408AC|nr:MaoC family dehydratase N-terminal domain-containing protein [Microbacterium sp. HD4P20]MCP2635422.1 MaoC family dehydratase N-terminal domain-containing protein [Microbacterium sp. HD4P20]
MSVVRTEPVAPAAVEAYRGTFAASEPVRAAGAELPPAWEGLLFPFSAPLADLRPDGTPAHDGVIPAIDLPRRMYAGETTEFLRPVHVGDDVVQTTSLGDVAEKNGSRGRLVFVDIERDFAVGGEVAIRSVWHDVFLEAADPDAAARPPRPDPAAAAGAEWSEEVTLDARQLFRFSALTFNTHLIHYDRAWAREVEGLPDLLVHGPLTRILLMDAARRNVPGRRARRLDIRAIAPVLVDRGLRIFGRTAGDTTRVTGVDPDDVVVTTAEITWA